MNGKRYTKDNSINLTIESFQTVHISERNLAYVPVHYRDPFNVEIESNVVTLHMVTDTSRQYSGFLLKYSTFDITLGERRYPEVSANIIR